MAKRILILGASGFMGGYLARHLDACGDYTLVCPMREKVKLASVAALSALIEEARPHTIVNLAAISSVTTGDVQALYEVNAFGHHNLLLAAAQATVRPRILLASSANIYGQNRNTAFRETDAPAPVNHYAASKVLAESLCGLFSDQLSIAYARPFNCIGRHQSPNFLLPKLISGYRSRQPVISLGATDIVRDFVDIRDVARMWQAVIDAEDFCGPLNFGSGIPNSIPRVLDLLGRISGHDPEISTQSTLLRPLDIVYACADIRLLHAVAGKNQYNLEDTLQWMLDSDE